MRKDLVQEVIEPVENVAAQAAMAHLPAKEPVP
jgi:hypothetical protein